MAAQPIWDPTEHSLATENCIGPLLTSCLEKNKKLHMNAHTTHEQTQVTCFLTADSNVQAITQACVQKKRGLCHQLNKGQQLDLSNPESACALQHHRSNITTRALFTIAATKHKEIH